MAASFTGKLLVASPELRDPNFYRTVVLLFEHGDQGAFGTVLNRPTEESAADYLPLWADQLTEPALVYVGGPVRNEVAVGVAEWATDDQQGDSLFSGVSFIDLTDPPEAGLEPTNLRVYSGYAGWDAGQLEVELAIDSWFIVEPIIEDVFGDTTDLWATVLKRQPGRLSLYAQFPHDLSTN